MPTPSADNPPSTEASQTTSRASSSTDFHMGALAPLLDALNSARGIRFRTKRDFSFTLRNCRDLSSLPLDFPLPPTRRCATAPWWRLNFPCWGFPISFNPIDSHGHCKDLQGYPQSSAYHCNRGAHRAFPRLAACHPRVTAPAKSNAGPPVVCVSAAFVCVAVGPRQHGLRLVA